MTAGRASGASAEARNTNIDTPQVLLQHHLKKLRLPTFQSEYAKLAQQCATENKDHVGYLLRLCELELIERERRMIERRIKAAKFPATKSLDSFDFKAIPSLNKTLTMELAPSRACCACAAGQGLRVCRPPRERHRARAKRHRQDPYQPGTRPGRLSEGAEGPLHHGSRVHQCLSDHWRSIGSLHELFETADERRLQRLQKQLAAQDLTNWASSPSARPAPSCSSRSSPSATSAARSLLSTMLRIV